MTNPIKDYGWEAVPRSFERLLASRPEIKKAEPVKVEDIKVPDTQLAKSVVDYARRELREETFNHSMRVFYYGQAIATQHFPHFHYTPETYLILCLLHDIGATTQNLHATHMSFEFSGAMLAHALLLSLAAPRAQADAVAEAIIRHQDLGDTGTLTTLAALVQLATVFDNVGLHPELVHRDTIEAVVRAWPRRRWTGCFAGIIRDEVEAKPWCHTTHIEGFAEMVEGNTLMAPFD
ncbi:MAG: hypothetical protein M1822_007851 [Bathelium mastoideum]|nr:MAG: hypothetical protein M1822_007851 [Bathelium mastoideum]